MSLLFHFFVWDCLYFYIVTSRAPAHLFLWFFSRSNWHEKISDTHVYFVTKYIFIWFLILNCWSFGRTNMVSTVTSWNKLQTDPNIALFVLHQANIRYLVTRTIAHHDKQKLPFSTVTWLGLCFFLVLVWHSTWWRCQKADLKY